MAERGVDYWPANEVRLKRDRDFTGSSRHGDITVQIRWDNGCLDVAAEPSWLRQLVNIGNLIEGLGEVTSDATDVGKIALGDAGPVINLLTTLAKGGDDILAAWIGDVAEHAATGAGFWQGQIPGLGSAGMPDPVAADQRASLAQPQLPYLDEVTNP